MNETPLYQHDCDKCVFLGIHEGADLYLCPVGWGEANLVARYGPNGDYASCPPDAQTHLPQLIEAKRRAIAAGLVKP